MNDMIEAMISCMLRSWDVMKYGRLACMYFEEFIWNVCDSRILGGEFSVGVCEIFSRSIERSSLAIWSEVNSQIFNRMVFNSNKFILKLNGDLTKLDSTIQD